MRAHRFKIGLAALSATALVAAGCGGSDKKDDVTPSAASTSTEKMHSMSASGKGGVGTGASTLRANLTAGLQEHVYLAGITVTNAIGKGLDSGEFEAAAGTLDKNSIALSKAIGSVYGDAAEKEFLRIWREHIGFFVDYTKGKATKDDAMVKKANADLDGYRAEFGAFLAKANPNLTQEAVSNDLKGHIATLEAAIDAVVAGKPEAFDLLQAAAAHMAGTAEVLSGAIAKQFPKKFPA